MEFVTTILPEVDKYIRNHLKEIYEVRIVFGTKENPDEFIIEFNIEGKDIDKRLEFEKFLIEKFNPINPGTIVILANKEDEDYKPQEKWKKD